MRHSLEQLETLVPQILGRGQINTPFDGYPILHSVFIELRDERDKTKHTRYIELINTILKYPGCNPDVLDKHRKPLLAYAAEQGKLTALKMLLKVDADPNLTSTQLQYTALEWAIRCNPASKAIPTLIKYTTKTSNILKNCQAMFDNALEEEDVDTINILVDLQLATYHPQFRNNLPALPPNVPTGFWMRTVTNPQKELKILLDREKLEDSILAKQRHTTTPDRNSYYTDYSPATYVRHSIPISIFGSHDAGLLIYPTNERIPYWFDGHREELTRDFHYHEGSNLNNGQRKGQLWEITPQQIQVTIEELYKKKISRHKKTVKEDGNEEEHRFDKHGIMLDKLLCEDVRFSWNEGLMRYKHKQIFGILVDPENEASCKKAFELKNILKLNVPFYDYREHPGTTHVVSAPELIQRWNLDISTTDKGLVKPLIMSNGHQLPKSKTINTVSHTMHGDRKMSNTRY